MTAARQPKVAEIAKFTPSEIEDYEDSLKHYRDLKNVMDTQREEGREEERQRIAKVLKEKDKALEENAKTLEEKDRQIRELQRKLKGK